MAGTEIVTVVRKPQRDNFGNTPAGTTQQWTVPGWQVAPGPSQEMGMGGAQVESDATIYGPPTTDINQIVAGGIQPTDLIVVRGDTYQVIGRVQDWGSAGAVIALKLVTG
jgi:hypothetical protein